jgi:hypothetical protein
MQQKGGTLRWSDFDGKITNPKKEGYGAYWEEEGVILL